MTAHRPTDSFDTPRPDDVAGDVHSQSTSGSADILIGRMVDLEASTVDREQFEHLAERDHELWRSLALKQRDMMLLANKLEEQTRFAERIDLPADGGLMRSRWPWAAAITGWAAVLLVAVLWMATTREQGERTGDRTERIAAMPTQSEMTADEYLAAYLKTGKATGQVINQMPPTLLETTELADGRLELRILRRIEESLVIEPDQLPVQDANGNLMRDPSELRQKSRPDVQLIPN